MLRISVTLCTSIRKVCRERLILGFIGLSVCCRYEGGSNNQCVMCVVFVFPVFVSCDIQAVTRTYRNGVKYRWCSVV